MLSVQVLQCSYAHEIRRIYCLCHQLFHCITHCQSVRRLTILNERSDLCVDTHGLEGWVGDGSSHLKIFNPAKIVYGQNYGKIRYMFLFSLSSDTNHYSPSVVLLASHRISLHPVL